MAIRLDITLTTKDGALNGVMTIDGDGVAIHNGAGQKDVEPGHHEYIVFLTGPKDCSCTYEIKQGASSRAGDTFTVPDDEGEATDSGGFPTV